METSALNSVDAVRFSFTQGPSLLSRISTRLDSATVNTDDITIDDAEQDTSMDVEDSDSLADLEAGAKLLERIGPRADTMLLDSSQDTMDTQADFPDEAKDLSSNVPQAGNSSVLQTQAETIVTRQPQPHSETNAASTLLDTSITLFNPDVDFDRSLTLVSDNKDDQPKPTAKVTICNTAVTNQPQVRAALEVVEAEYEHPVEMDVSEELLSSIGDATISPQPEKEKAADQSSLPDTPLISSQATKVVIPLAAAAVIGSPSAEAARLCNLQLSDLSSFRPRSSSSLNISMLTPDPFEAMIASVTDAVTAAWEEEAKQRDTRSTLHGTPVDSPTEREPVTSLASQEKTSASQDIAPVGAAALRTSSKESVEKLDLQPTGLTQVERRPNEKLSVASRSTTSPKPSQRAVSSCSSISAVRASEDPKATASNAVAANATLQSKQCTSTEDEDEELEYVDSAAPEGAIQAATQLNTNQLANEPSQSPNFESDKDGDACSSAQANTTHGSDTQPTRFYETNYLPAEGSRRNPLAASGEVTFGLPCEYGRSAVRRSPTFGKPLPLTPLDSADSPPAKAHASLPGKPCESPAPFNSTAPSAAAYARADEPPKTTTCSQDASSLAGAREDVEVDLNADMGAKARLTENNSLPLDDSRLVSRSLKRWHSSSVNIKKEDLPTASQTSCSSSRPTKIMKCEDEKVVLKVEPKKEESHHLLLKAEEPEVKQQPQDTNATLSFHEAEDDQQLSRAISPASSFQYPSEVPEITTTEHTTAELGSTICTRNRPIVRWLGSDTAMDPSAMQENEEIVTRQATRNDQSRLIARPARFNRSVLRDEEAQMSRTRLAAEITPRTEQESQAGTPNDIERARFCQGRDDTQRGRSQNERSMNRYPLAPARRRSLSPEPRNSNRNDGHCNDGHRDNEPSGQPPRSAQKAPPSPRSIRGHNHYSTLPPPPEPSADNVRLGNHDLSISKSARGLNERHHSRPEQSYRHRSPVSPRSPYGSKYRHEQQNSWQPVATPRDRIDVRDQNNFIPLASPKVQTVPNLSEQRSSARADGPVHIRQEHLRGANTAHRPPPKVDLQHRLGVTNQDALHSQETSSLPLADRFNTSPGYHSTGSQSAHGYGSTSNYEATVQRRRPEETLLRSHGPTPSPRLLGRLSDATSQSPITESGRFVDSQLRFEDRDGPSLEDRLGISSRPHNVAYQNIQQHRYAQSARSNFENAQDQFSDHQSHNHQGHSSRLSRADNTGGVAPRGNTSYGRPSSPRGHSNRYEPYSNTRSVQSSNRAGNTQASSSRKYDSYTQGNPNKRGFFPSKRF